MKTRRSELGLLVGMGWGIAAWLVLGILAGNWADGRFDIGPWGTLAGAVAGIAGAGVTLWRTVRRLEEGSRVDTRSVKPPEGKPPAD